MFSYTTNCITSKNCYCPMLVTCQMHTDYTVSAHDILIFEPFSVVFVKCTDNNRQVDFFIVQVCHAVHTECNKTAIAQWSKPLSCTMIVVRSTLVTSRFLFNIHVPFYTLQPRILAIRLFYQL